MCVRMPGLKKNFFQPFGPQSGLRITGGEGRRAPRAPTLDLPLLYN